MGQRPTSNGDEQRPAAPTGLHNDSKAVPPVAIVGFSLKLPQDAVSADAFWTMLTEGRCASTEFPADRLNIDGFYHPDRSRKDALPFRQGHFLLEDVATFDAHFFSISPAEAADMDPMQRGLLETTYRAFENAGMPMARVAGSQTSVYIGAFTHDYEILNFKDPWNIPRYHATGTTPSMLATRVSHFYDLRGASMCVDTACSSSMVALDLACQSLLSGDSSMSVVGGCNLIYSFETLAMMSNLNMLSPDGRCFSFDHRANGYARGEGFGVLVLKRLEDAIADKDVIRAVIRSTGTNQDGNTPGITQPSGDAQERLIRRTYEKAGLDMACTRFFEAHGTGTAVGDPTEAAAIGAAFRNHRTPSQPLYVGALKSNLGHLEGASGVAAIIKVVLALESGSIPPNTNFERLNDRIDAEYLRLAFPTSSVQWPHGDVRRASINSFGFGGTNAHAVLDDARSYLSLNGLEGHHETATELRNEACPEKANGVSLIKNGMPFQESSASLKLLVWSSADEEGLSRLRRSYDSYFDNLRSKRKPAELEDKLSSILFTLSRRRSQLVWRSFQVTSPRLDFLYTNSAAAQAACALSNPQLCFVFTGQGAQWVRMGYELFQIPVFRRSLQQSESHLLSLGANWNLVEEMQRPRLESRVDDVEFSQPLCTALQLGLVDYLSALGVMPTAVVGHSSGEIAAAYCSGAVSRRTALQIAFFRGKLAADLAQRQTRAGCMLVVGLGLEDVALYLKRVTSKVPNTCLGVACINSPNSVTISGDRSSVEMIEAMLNDDGVFARKLKVDVAYHSSHMNDIANAYHKRLQNLEPGEELTLARKPIMISSVTSDVVSCGELRRGGYWVENLISPVRFSEALSRICVRQGQPHSNSKIATCIDSFLEIGPHSALQGPIRDVLKSVGLGSEIMYTATLRRNESSMQTLMTALGQLYCRGHEIDIWAANNPSNTRDEVVSIDLPGYPFDHSNSYWVEPEISRKSRLFKKPRLDLLGVQMSTSFNFDRRWRNKISASEMPWVEDHQMTNTTVYPAAGMLVMAVEAANQCADTQREVIGFSIRNVSFKNALRVLDLDTNVEVAFYLRSDPSHSWSEFGLSCLDNNHWKNVCQGWIQVEYTNTNNQALSWEDLVTEAQVFTGLLKVSESSPQYTVQRQEWYEACQQRGLGFGPAFQCLDSIRSWRGNFATASLNISTPSTAGESHPQPHIIHPTSLDGVVQMFFVAAAEGQTGSIETRVPAHLESMWLSKQGLNWETTTTLDLFARTMSQGHRKTSYVLGRDVTTGRPRLAIEGLAFASIVTKVPEIDEDVPYLCCNIRWQPDLDLLSKDEVLEYCNRTELRKPDPMDFYHDLRDISISHIQRELSRISDRPINQFSAKIQRYIKWMQHQLELHDNEVPALDDTAYTALANRLEHVNGESKLYIEYGRIMHHIVDGDLDPLAFFFNDSDLTKNFYHEVIDNASYIHPFKEYLNLLVHKNSRMKLLEIGAGTGSFTTHVFDALKGHNYGADITPKFDEYVFTDISTTFFEDARAAFARGDRTKFKVFDLQQSPSEQGFLEGDYDVVIAAGVLHIVADLDIGFQHVRKLLRPGGKLILIELTNPDRLGCGFPFGTIDGWWGGVNDPRRVWGPAMNVDQWNESATANGFSEAEFVVHDFEHLDCRERSLLVFDAIEPSVPVEMGQPLTMIIVSSDVPAQMDLGSRLEAHLRTKGEAHYRIIPLEDAVAQSMSGVAFISLLDVEATTIAHMDEPQYRAIKSLLLQSSSLLWISRPSHDEDVPDLGIFDGLSRTVRTENPSLNLVALKLERAGATESEIIAIEKIYFASKRGELSDKRDSEYRSSKGIICSPRLVEDRLCDYRTADPTTNLYRAPRMLHQGPSLTLQIQVPGVIDSLRFIQENDQPESIGAHEIEVEVKAAGINALDLLFASGNTAAKTTMGTEFAGIVRAAGSDSRFKPSDRVAVAYQEGFKSYARVPDSCAVSIPDDLGFPEAAAISVGMTTAWHALKNVANLRPREIILIHSATSGVGQAAIQIAQDIGAEIYVTVGSLHKRHYLNATYGIIDDHISSSRDTSFVQAMKRATGGRGVDVVLNCLPGDRRIASLDCLAPHGRFAELGREDVSKFVELSVHALQKNVTLSLIDMPSFPSSSPKLLREILEAVMSKVKNGQLRPVQPLKRYGFGEASTAFRDAENEDTIEKVVLEARADEVIPAMLSRKPVFDFREDGTYIISGGLGGLGRAIALWMADRGARHLILLSRSGMRPELHDFRDELLAKGVHVESPACDICDETALQQTLEHCLRSMPPILGCIQATAVLQDGFFERMSYEDWTLATRAKTVGSWNLHSILPHDLDFFVFISSLCGIVGKETTANYAAGNSYLDELARFRLSQGLKAISLDLGLMEEVGLLAANPALMASAKSNGSFTPLFPSQLYELLNIVCDPSYPLPEPDNAQLVVGLATPAVLRAQDQELPPWYARPLFGPLFSLPLPRSSSTDEGENGTAAPGTSSVVDFAHVFQQAASLDEASKTVVEALRIRVARALDAKPENVEVEKPPIGYGVDSLVAVELKNWFAQKLKSDVSVFDIMGSISFSELSRAAAGKSKFWVERKGTENGSVGGKEG